MDALVPLKQLNELEATQCGPGRLPGWSFLPWPAGQEEFTTVPAWSPLLDISESEKEYLIQAELPGVRRGSIKIMALENTLTITGRREFQKDATSKKRLRAERAFGSFGRRLSLPDDANPAQIGTEFIDGVLTVRLAKKERSTQQEEVVDEITAWWQKALGTKAVLGQASNRPRPGPRVPAPQLLWTKPESGQAERERTVLEATRGTTETKGANHSGTQRPKGRLWMDTSPTALKQLKDWLAVMVNDAVFFLIIVLLRFAVAAFVATRASLGLLAGEFRRARHGTRSFQGVPAVGEFTTWRA